MTVARRRPLRPAQQVGGTVTGSDPAEQTLTVHLWDDPHTGERCEVTVPLPPPGDLDAAAYLSLTDSGSVAMVGATSSAPTGLVRFPTYADLLAGTFTPDPLSNGATP